MAAHFRNRAMKDPSSRYGQRFMGLPFSGPNPSAQSFCSSKANDKHYDEWKRSLSSYSGSRPGSPQSGCCSRCSCSSYCMPPSPTISEEFRISEYRVTEDDDDVFISMHNTIAKCENNNNDHYSHNSGGGSVMFTDGESDGESGEKMKRNKGKWKDNVFLVTAWLV